MGSSMSQEKWKHFPSREMGRHNGPPKVLGARIQNKSQMGELPVGSPADSFPDLLCQSVGLSQKSRLRPGSGVHSCPDPEPSFPL